MNQAEQAQKAERFRAMHGAPPLLLLPNAWDAISARIVVAAGFQAIATTSGGVAWALGYADGEAAPWQEVVAATARIARAVARAGHRRYRSSAMATRQRRSAARSATSSRAGAVGVNLEDGCGQTRQPAPPIRSLEDAAARIRAAREAARAAGVPIVINARTDLYIKNIGDDKSRFDEAVARGRAYLAAGADCVYPIALRDSGDDRAPRQGARRARSTSMCAPGSPSVAELEALGVKRASTATVLPLMAMGLVARGAPSSCTRPNGSTRSTRR